MRKSVIISAITVLLFAPTTTFAACSLSTGSTNCSCNTVGTAAAGGNYFFLGEQGKQISVMTSVGQFTAPTTNFSSQTLIASRDIAYGNGIFVAVGDNPSYTAYASSVMGPWNMTSLSAPGAVKARVKFFNNLFVATVSISNTVITSPDGKTWTGRTLPRTGDWRYLAHRPTGLIMALSSEGSTARSSNGQAWSSGASISTATYGAWVGLEYGGSYFFAMSELGYITRSVDGATWSQPRRIFDSENMPSNITDANIRIQSFRVDSAGVLAAVYVDRTVPATKNGFMISYNGGTWCSSPHNAANLRNLSIAEGGGGILAAGYNSVAYWTSVSSCGRCDCVSDCTHHDTQTILCGTVPDGVSNGIQICDAIKNETSGCYKWSETINCSISCNSGFGLTSENSCSRLCTAGYTYLRLSNGVNIPLYQSKNTSPAIHIKNNAGTSCYGSLRAGTEATNALKVNYSNNTYYSIN